MKLAERLHLSLIVGLALYAVTGAWVLTRSASLGVRPSLGSDTALVGAAEGFIVGAGSALLMVALLRLAFGHPVLDPTAALLAADGALVPLLLGVVTIVVMAPLVEELVFRGFLTEAFREKGRWEAITVSAIAFSLIHLRLGQFRYYLFLGVALAVVYLRRGLIGSICAHAAFNGMLIVVALSASHGPPVESVAAGARISLPAAWSARAGAVGYDLVGTGPAGSRVELAHTEALPGLQSPEGLGRALRSGPVPLPGDVSVDPTSVTEIDLPAGRAVSASATGDRDGRVVIVPKGTRLWMIALHPAGLARDGGDFDSILRSWHLP